MTTVYCQMFLITLTLTSDKEGPEEGLGWGGGVGWGLERNNNYKLTFLYFSKYKFKIDKKTGQPQCTDIP